MLGVCRDEWHNGSILSTVETDLTIDGHTDEDVGNGPLASLFLKVVLNVASIGALVESRGSVEHIYSRRWV